MEQAIYHPGPVQPSLLTRQHEHRSELVWDDKIAEDFRLRTNFKSYWDTVRDHPPPGPVIEAITNAGLFGVYATGMLRHDAGLITAFVDRWRPETHTFHMRFGEVSITLEDVYFILGLRSGGLEPERGMVQKGGINIGWLVRNFGSCAAISDYSDAYDDQLVFHIRAHLLLLLGSLFPHCSGNRLQLRLLHYVRHIQAVRTYSWGSACLAYLYKQLCIASIGKVKNLCGSMTLLQVWIYEHFRGLAPVPRDPCLMQHPCALRWVRIRMYCADVVDHSSRLVRCYLDAMRESDFVWMPYEDSAADAFQIPGDERALMTAPCPLFFDGLVEWCYTDRVTRQFGFLQPIPTASPVSGHASFHGVPDDWETPLADLFHSWHSRGDRIMAPPGYCSMRRPTCTDEYSSWYDRVTRRFIINPAVWPRKQGFQGTQGQLPMASLVNTSASAVVQSKKRVPRKKPTAAGRCKKKRKCITAKQKQHSPLVTAGHETPTKETMDGVPVVEHPSSLEEERPRCHEMHLGETRDGVPAMELPSLMRQEKPPAETYSVLSAAEPPPHPEEEKPKLDLLFLLEPARKPKDRQHLMNAASVLKSQLVARLTSNADKLSTEAMIIFADQCYNTLRKLGDNSTCFKTEVNKLIAQHRVLTLAAEKKENLNGTDRKERYVQLAELLSDATKKLSSAQYTLLRMRSDAASLKLKIEELTSESLKLKKELSKERERVMLLTAERDECKEAIAAVESELGKLDTEKEAARVAFEEINARYYVDKKEFEKMSNQLLRSVSK